MLLIIFAFVAGIVTILSPCILPLLPIILSSSVGSPGKARPLGVVTGFVLSFTISTLFLSTLVSRLGVSAEALRSISIIVLALFGLTLLIPKLQLLFERLSSHLANIAPTTARPGFGGGIIVGLSLGLLWTPCVGPILASVITLAASSSITWHSLAITLAYALGTGLPMFLIMYFGASALRLPTIVKYSATIQRVFGVLMILTALAIYAGFDRQFQSYILDRFPQYGSGLTKFEDNNLVRSALQTPTEDDMKKYQAPDLIVGGDWINSDPLTLKALKGKVVLVDFWTYSCINCQRTLPYLRTWHQKYQEEGLVIIGVHSPEFEFEKDLDNLKSAVTDFGLVYPIMQDNDFATWKSYKNRYWPAKYIIDSEGYVRYTHFGEGDYDETEAVIQKLLKESGSNISSSPSNPTPSPNMARTHETYLGLERSEPSPDLKLVGDWEYDQQYAHPLAGASLTYEYSASSAYLVMRTNDGEIGQLKVYIDNMLTQTIMVDKDTLYPLIEGAKPGSHTLKLEFETDNLELYAFTFG